jgi:hypothetical protein
MSEVETAVPPIESILVETGASVDARARQA